MNLQTFHDNFINIAIFGGIYHVVLFAIYHLISKKFWKNILLVIYAIIIIVFIVMSIFGIWDNILEPDINENLLTPAQATVDTIDNFQDGRISVIEMRDIVEIWAESCDSFNGYLDLELNTVITEDEQALKEAIKNLKWATDMLSYDYGGGNEFGGDNVYFDDLYYQQFADVFYYRNEVAKIMKISIRSDYK